MKYTSRGTTTGRFSASKPNVSNLPRPQRDADGLFEIRCDNCSAKLWSSTDAIPAPNCEYCPGHDEIAVRNQAAADKDCIKPKREKV